MKIKTEKKGKKDRENMSPGRGTADGSRGGRHKKGGKKNAGFGRKRKLRDQKEGYGKKKSLRKAPDKGFRKKNSVSSGREGDREKSLDKSRIFEGVFSQHEKGFGFVTVEGREEDIFIPADRTGAAFHNDRVELYMEKDSSGDGSYRAEGRILRVLDHGISEVIGSFHKHQNFGFVVPDDRHILSDIYVDRDDFCNASNGDKVVVRIKDYGDRRRKPEGEITEVLGGASDKGVDITSAVRMSGVRYSFPEEVQAELSSIPDEVRKKDLRGRRDFRDSLCITIDGDDSKDFDDAVSLSFDKESGMYELSVHIADVAEYVKEKSELDKEAEERGTSIYLPDRVIPMLPKKLSNGICSLNEGVDRLTLSCIMRINSKGEIVDHEICEGVIRSRRRLTYKYVYSLLTDKLAARAEKDKELLAMLKLMLRLSKILRRKREKDGSVDFDFPESVITLDKNGRVTDISLYEINDANRMIEDFMLAANETVAKEFELRKIPFLYRCHEAPSEEKAEELIELVRGLGFSIRKDKKGLKDPARMAALLRKVEGSPEEPLIEKMALRSMSKAKYLTECLGHYGLSKQYYTHFTSPIRRYPDLQIHRIIKECLRNEGSLRPRRQKHYANILPGVAEHCSDTERKADELERDCDKIKKCEYMSRFIGECFDGIISGVTAYGFYVELPNTCEGMVHVNSMTDDYYIFDEKKLRLTGERGGKTYALGDRISIVVTAADKLTKTIDFRVYYG